MKCGEDFEECIQKAIAYLSGVTDKPAKDNNMHLKTFVLSDKIKLDLFELFFNLEIMGYLNTTHREELV